MAFSISSRYLTTGSDGLNPGLSAAGRSAVAASKYATAAAAARSWLSPESSLTRRRRSAASRFSRSPNVLQRAPRLPDVGAAWWPPRPSLGASPASKPLSLHELSRWPPLLGRALPGRRCFEARAELGRLATRTVPAEAGRTRTAAGVWPLVTNWVSIALVGRCRRFGAFCVPPVPGAALDGRAWGVFVRSGAVRSIRAETGRRTGVWLHPILAVAALAGRRLCCGRWSAPARTRRGGHTTLPDGGRLIRACSSALTAWLDHGLDDIRIGGLLSSAIRCADGLPPRKDPSRKAMVWPVWPVWPAPLSAVCPQGTQ